MPDRLPPTPRGYHPIKMPVTDFSVTVLSCDKCGGLVLMTRTHDAWHKKNG